jgi:hypothetical protein
MNYRTDKPERDAPQADVDNQFRADDAKAERARREFNTATRYWLKAVRFAKSPYHFAVASCIADHINWKTGKGYLTDEIIAELMGGGAIGYIGRKRRDLKRDGLLTWQTTG